MGLHFPRCTFSLSLGRRDSRFRDHSHKGGLSLTDPIPEGTPVASSSLLTIADDVIDDDDDEEGKLMIDEGDEDEKEGKEEEEEEEEETTLDTPIVNVQPPTPIGDRRMELIEREGESERGTVGEGKGWIDN